MFVLNSEITIGNFRFTGVHDVEIKRSVHHISEKAVIKIPSMAKVMKDGKVLAESLITGKQFIDGDPVTINLGYDESMQTEFRGFVRRRNMNMPLEIECEGYSWLLRRNTIQKFWRSVKVSELLKEAVSGLQTGYEISIICDTDVELTNIVANNLSGYDIIENIGKYTDGCLSCFFIRPGVLWCGSVYTSIASGSDPFGVGSVNYRLGYNTIRDNTLKERFAETEPVEVKYSKKLPAGSRISETSDVFKNHVRTHSGILNNQTDATTLKLLANEKAYRLNYAGYEGSVTTFLQPFSEPGYVAGITDDDYPERNGQYLIESTRVLFGMNGAKRIIEIGPRLGFANTQ